MIWIVPLSRQSSTGNTHKERERETTCWREGRGWGRSQIIRQQERLVLCKSFNTLCSNNSARSHPTNIHNLVLIRNGNVIIKIWVWCNDTTTSLPPPHPQPFSHCWILTETSSIRTPVFTSSTYSWLQEFRLFNPIRHSPPFLPS